MSIHFSGITVFTGPKHKVQNAVDTAPTKDMFAVKAQFSIRAVMLDGADSDVFFKKKLKIDVPEPLRKAASQAEIDVLLRTDDGTYQDVLFKLASAPFNELAFTEHVFDYVEERKAQGNTDASGNPIQEVAV